MIAVSASVGVGIMIDSFRRSVVRWLETSLQADVYVSAPSLVSTRADSTLNPEVIARLRAVPGIAAIGSQRTVRVPSTAGPVRVIVLTLASGGDRAFALKEGDRRRLWPRFEAGEVVLVSEPFAYHRRLGVGDRVRLRTDAGERDFAIGGIVYDYGSSEGVVMMGRRAYERFWADREISALGIYAEQPAELDALISALRRAAGPDADVFIRSNRALREASLVVFDRTFAVTRVLRWLAMAVAFVGVLSALMAQALDRVREIGVLRAQGLTQAQVWGLTASQTGFMGLVAGLLALPVGSVLALVLIFVINRRSFGWTLQLEIAPAILSQAVLLAVGAALLAALYPGWRMSTMALAAALREE
jgi:putative ABC transport system permease protein